MSEKPDVPSAEKMTSVVLQIVAGLQPGRVAPAVEGSLAEWEQRIRAATLAPFYDLVDWDSEENLEDDHAERWIKLGDKLRSLLPPKEAPDD